MFKGAAPEGSAPRLALGTYDAVLSHQAHPKETIVTAGLAAGPVLSPWPVRRISPADAAILAAGRTIPVSCRSSTATSLRRGAAYAKHNHNNHLPRLRGYLKRITDGSTPKAAINAACRT